MQITFLGTSAAEGFPDPFCICQNCEAARAEGGASLRLHSSALVNNDLLIDLGPDLIAAGMHHGLLLNSIPYALQTHPHNDHLDAITLFSRAQMCQVRGCVPLHLHCSATAVNRMDTIMGLEGKDTTFRDPVVQEQFALRIIEIAPWMEVTVGPYRVQTVEANHDPGIEAMLYAIEDTRDGTRLFYGTDTGSLPPETWTRLADLGWAFDLFILDHTFGFGDRSSGHLNQAQFLEEVAVARAAGLLGDSSRVIATHLAHHSNPAHQEMVRLAADQGYEIAFDGWSADARGAVYDHVSTYRIVSA